MSGLIEEIQELQKHQRILNNAIERIIELRSYVQDCEDGDEGSGRRLAKKVSELIERYESMSTGAIAQIKAQGFAEDRVRKYLESTYQGEKIKACRIDNKNIVSVVTNKGIFELGESGEFDMYNFWADGLLLELKEYKGLTVSKY